MNRLRSRYSFLLLGLLPVLACSGTEAALRFECEDSQEIAVSAVCDRTYDCADRTDEATCHYNGTAETNPIDSWDFDARAAMQSSVDGTPNADARFIQEALAANMTASELPRSLPAPARV